MVASSRHSRVVGMQEMMRQTSVSPKGACSQVNKMGNNCIKHVCGLVTVRQRDRCEGRRWGKGRKKGRQVLKENENEEGERERINEAMILF